MTAIFPSRNTKHTAHFRPQTRPARGSRVKFENIDAIIFHLNRFSAPHGHECQNRPVIYTPAQPATANAPGFCSSWPESNFCSGVSVNPCRTFLFRFTGFFFHNAVYCAVQFFIDFAAGLSTAFCKSFFFC